MVKPHGLRGDVIVSLTTNRVERVDPGSVLTTADGRQLPGGALLAPRGPLHRGVRRGGRTDDAEQLRGIELFAAPLEDPDTLWVHELVGCGGRGHRRAPGSGRW